MKTALYDGSRRVIVNTNRDICLVSEANPSPKSADVQIYHKDLYLHKGPSDRAQYYFHVHSSGAVAKDQVIPVSPVMAERYLLHRGIICNEFPESEPVLRLYNWGYGIAEEF
jgi:hypothetical protein